MVLEKLHAHDFKVKQSNMNFDLSFTVYLKKKKKPKIHGLTCKMENSRTLIRKYKRTSGNHKNRQTPCIWQ